MLLQDSDAKIMKNEAKGVFLGLFSKAGVAPLESGEITFFDAKYSVF